MVAHGLAGEVEDDGEDGVRADREPEDGEGERGEERGRDERVGGVEGHGHAEVGVEACGSGGVLGRHGRSAHTRRGMGDEAERGGRRRDGTRGVVRVGRGSVVCRYLAGGVGLRTSTCRCGGGYMGVKKGACGGGDQAEITFRVRIEGGATGRDLGREEGG